MGGSGTSQHVVMPCLKSVDPSYISGEERVFQVRSNQIKSVQFNSDVSHTLILVTYFLLIIISSYS